MVVGIIERFLTTAAESTGEHWRALALQTQFNSRLLKYAPLAAAPIGRRVLKRIPVILKHSLHA
jgi:hypothetical protein